MKVWATVVEVELVEEVELVDDELVDEFTVVDVVEVEDVDDGVEPDDVGEVTELDDEPVPRDGEELDEPDEPGDEEEEVDSRDVNVAVTSVVSDPESVVLTVAPAASGGGTVTLASITVPRTSETAVHDRARASARASAHPIARRVQVGIKEVWQAFALEFLQPRLGNC